MIKLVLFLQFTLFNTSILWGADLNHSVSGSSEDNLTIENSKVVGESPYVYGTTNNSEIEKSPSIIIDEKMAEKIKDDPKRDLKGFGYTLPGTYENSKNYLEVDKKKVVKDFRTHSDGALNLTFIKNNYDYTSQNDIIEKTIGEGFRSIKGGALYIRHDSYITKSFLLNSHWSIGSGVGFNSGRGLFVTGSRSDTRFNLWEVPFDVGVGLEVPLYSWFKISGTLGPSATVLVQNRSDYQRGEDGKRKIQYSYGQFANAQFKINLTGFSDQKAYDVFSTSEITNLFLNLELRYQNYENFQDDIKISGTSFGVGFTFEYL